jgi:hypothetical protein
LYEECNVILGFMIVTINQFPTLLFWEETFNYSLRGIKVLDFVGLGCVHARCSCGVSGVDVLEFSCVNRIELSA